jgi:hypothetical protein
MVDQVVSAIDIKENGLFILNGKQSKKVFYDVYTVCTLCEKRKRIK